MDVYANSMNCREFMDYAHSKTGVLRVERLSRERVEQAVATEEALKTVTGGLRMENSGILTCASCRDVFVMLCDGSFPRPDKITMAMVDDRGVVVGHDVPGPMVPQFEGRGDVMWLSSNFVLYPEKMAPYDVRMVMRASRVEWAIPSKVVPWIYYPSPETANLLGSWLGNSDSTISTVLMGVNGLDAQDVSVPVPDMVEVPCAGSGHGEPSPQDTFYRCDLVCELLEVAELPLADQDFHALVVIEMDVHRGVDQGLVVVLDVGKLVPDRCHGMIVHHDDRPDHPFVVVLPFRFGEGVAHQVPYRLRPADVALLGDGFVELLEQLRFERNAYARDAFHDGDYPISCFNIFAGHMAP